MNKSSKLFATLAASVLMPGAASAAITVSSSVSFDFSQFAVTPSPTFYGYSGGYFGSVTYYNPATNQYDYPFTPNGQMFFDSTYETTLSGNFGTVSARWNESTGATELSLQGVNSQASPVQTMISLGTGNPFTFLGPYSTLPDFSYSFDMSGEKMLVSDQIGASVQLQLGYQYYDEASQRWNEVRLYSDYADYGYGFRTNWVYHFSASGDPLMSYAEAGTRAFSGFSTLDGQPHHWFIEYGISAVGIATEDGYNQTVPEPGSHALILMGIGALLITGISCNRRRATARERVSG